MTNKLAAEELLKDFVQLNEFEQESILQLIKTFIAKKNVRETPQTIEEYNIEIKAAFNRAKNGEFTSIESLKTEMEEW
jgi:hypothetical protein